jgi:hypothetical protein
MELELIYQILSDNISKCFPENQEFLEKIALMNSKHSNPLLNLLHFSLALLFVILPTILAILNREFIGVAFPMGAIGLWLILFGRVKIGGISIEGKQAYSVGSSLLLPLFISGAVHQLGLWPPLAISAIVVGLCVAIVLYFAVKSTAVPKERTVVVIIFLSGVVLTIIGNTLDAPSDSAGVILVNGIPLLPVPSLILLIQSLGFATIVVGLYGLIFGFTQKKK